jgi:hypothetical protein
MKGTTHTLDRRVRRLALVGVAVTALVASSAAQAEYPGPAEDLAGTAITYETPDTTSFSLPPGAMAPSFSLPPGAMVQAPEPSGGDLAAPTGDLAGTPIAREVPGPSTLSLPPGAMIQTRDTGGGIDFGDAGLGAAVTVGATLLLAAAAFATSRRRRHSGSLSGSPS